MFDVKICVSFDGKVKRLKECHGIVLFSDKLVKTRKAVAMVDEKYNIKLFNFKLLDEKSVKAYGRLVNTYIDEYYMTAFRISTALMREYFLAPCNAYSTGFAYFKTAIALSLPIFFINRAVPYMEDFIPTVFSDIMVRMNLFEWLLFPIAFDFAANEVITDLRLQENGTLSREDIVRCFLSYLCWHRSERFLLSVKNFIEFLESEVLRK